MWILAQSGLHPWSLELVVEITGQVLQPHGRVPSEHALALIQFLLQSCHIQLSGAENCMWDRGKKVAEGGFHMWNHTILPDSHPEKVWGRTLENAELSACSWSGVRQETRDHCSVGLRTQTGISSASILFLGSPSSFSPMFLTNTHFLSILSAYILSFHISVLSGTPLSTPSLGTLTAFSASSRHRNGPCFWFWLVIAVTFFGCFLFIGFLDSAAGGGTCSLFCRFMIFSKPRS